MPTAFLSASGASTTVEQDETGYYPGWQYERVDIVVDDTGVIEFSWVSPYTEPEIITADAGLLHFSDIAGICEKLIVMKNNWIDPETAVDINIDRVELCLMRITEADKRDTGILIPVWNLIGQTSYRGPEIDETNPVECLLTINAVDGSIIDAELGY